VRLDVVWHPTIPGEINTEFVIAFDDPASDNVEPFYSTYCLDSYDMS
jgi:hypothetical protein